MYEGCLGDGYELGGRGVEMEMSGVFEGGWMHGVGWKLLRKLGDFNDRHIICKYGTL